TSGVYSPEKPPNQIARPGTMLLRGKPGWTDYRFSASMRNYDVDGMGLVFRYAGPNDHYRFSWDRERSLRRLTRVVGGTWTVLQQDTVPYVTGRWYRVNCEAVGAVLRIVIDGVVWAEVNDSSIPAGMIGLYSWQSSNLSFDNVEV